jgi:glutamate 5-kinase
VSRFPRPGRVVVKVGSSSLRAPDGGLDAGFATSLVGQLAGVRAEGVDVVLVSSGAVAAGLAPLGLTRRPGDLPGLQAAASVGQGLLLHTYQAGFAARGLACGQVLLTPDDVVHRPRFLNARNTFERLLALGAVPVVNENDTVATDELRFSDNDRLAALVVSMLGADLLVLLSDVDGLHDGHPSTGAPLLDRVDDIGALDGRHWGTSSSDVGRGGMAGKLEAARIATFSAAHVVIANARRPGVVAAAVDGERVGTWFPPSPRRPESRKLWIAFAPRPRGVVVVDEGAVRALTTRGSSLLAAGVVDALGDFASGDAVDVVGPDRTAIARGLVAYDRRDVLRVRGSSSEQVAATLGPDARAEIIHRDRLVLTG